MAKEHTIAKRPNNRILKLKDIPKSSSNERTQKHIILQLAFTLANNGFKLIAK